jgi:hypothetical protein
MAASRTAIYINPKSELADALRCAETTGEKVYIDTGDLVFGIVVMTAQDAREAAGYRPGERNAFLDIAGIGESKEPSDVERFKDDYLADVLLSKPE